jgi:hypothetical protein
MLPDKHAFPLSRFSGAASRLHPADCARLPQLLADVGLALVLRALDLFHAPGDHIEEESNSTMPCMHCARCEGKSIAVI